MVEESPLRYIHRTMLRMCTHLGKRTVSITTNCFGFHEYHEGYSIAMHEGKREKKCHTVQGMETH